MTERPLDVFVVEDHEDTLKYLTIYLEQCGHRVSSARTLAKAVEMLPSAQCDVLISDLGLPDGTGWELLQAVNLKRPVYAIVMSGFGMTADLSRSKAAGFRHHLVKPVNPDELDTMLEEAARERHEREAEP